MTFLHQHVSVDSWDSASEKRGVERYRIYCLGLLRNMASSRTPEDLARRCGGEELEDLEQLRLWATMAAKGYDLSQPDYVQLLAAPLANRRSERSVTLPMRAILQKYRNDWIVQNKLPEEQREALLSHVASLAERADEIDAALDALQKEGKEARIWVPAREVHHLLEHYAYFPRAAANHVPSIGKHQNGTRDHADLAPETPSPSVPEAEAVIARMERISQQYEHAGEAQQKWTEDNGKALRDKMADLSAMAHRTEVALGDLEKQGEQAKTVIDPRELLPLLVREVQTFASEGQPPSSELMKLLKETAVAVVKPGENSSKSYNKRHVHLRLLL